MNFAGVVIDEDDESEWQIIDDRLSDCSSDGDKLAFRVFAYVAGFNRKWPHFRTTGLKSSTLFAQPFKLSELLIHLVVQAWK